MMDGHKHISAIRSYCDYLERHLNDVEAAWVVLQKALKHENVIYDDHLFNFIDGQIKGHDLSKFSQAEFIPYQQEFFPATTDANPFDFEEACLHHKFNNRHHWESALCLPEKFPNEHSCHLIHMVADWMAMGMRFGDTAEEYYHKNLDSIDMPDWAHEFLGKIFALLSLQEVS